MKDKLNKNRIILCFHILIQILLTIKTLYLVEKVGVLNINILIHLSLSILNIINYYLFMSNKRKKLVVQGSVISIISIIYIMTNMVLLETHSNWNIHIFSNIVLMSLIIYYTNLFTEDLLYLKKYYKVIGLCLLFQYASKIISDTLFMIILQLSYFFMGIFPIYIIIKYGKKLKEYSNYGYKRLFVMSLLFLIVIESQFFIPIIDFSKTNFDIYLIIILLEVIKLNLESIYFKNQKGLLIRNYIQYDLLLLALFMGLLFFVFKKPILLSLVISIELLLIITMINRLKFSLNNKNSCADDLSITNNHLQEYINKQEMLHIEKTISFLHDEILQYIIIALRQLKDDTFLENKETIIDLLQETINKIRGEINLYKPKIQDGDILCEVYFDLINKLQDRYKNDEILIDFNCDESLDLVEPYASVIYKCLHEIVVNIFKHSKGYYSEINLKKSKEKIFLNSVNYGDYMDIENNNKVNNVGLKILDLEVKKLGGKMDIKMNPNNLLEEEESTVSVSIEIPMKREVIYEDFINRRS